MANDRKIAEILGEYDNQLGRYATFADRVAGLLKDILAEHRIVVHSVAPRAKTRESLAKKLARSDIGYACLADVTDLAGVRVTTYLADDVDVVGRIIEAEFLVDSGNSVDKRAALDPDRFGYLSLHYVVGLSSARCALLEYRQYPALKIEIQVRSILQHAWAEIEHDLGYKAANEIPRHARRRFSRVAGLLELADDEFIAIREELNQYAKDVPLQIAESPQTVLLDKPSLIAFIGADPVVGRLDAAIAGLLGAPLVAVDESNLEIAKLQKLGIETIGDLGSILHGHESAVDAFARQWIVERTYSTIHRGISLFYLRYVLIGERQDENLARELLFDIGSSGDTDTLVRAVFLAYRRSVGKSPHPSR